MTVNVPEILLKLRLSKKLRQKEMAAQLDIPNNTYRAYELGKRTPPSLAMKELLRRIAVLENGKPE